MVIKPTHLPFFFLFSLILASSSSLSSHDHHHQNSLRSHHQAPKECGRECGEPFGEQLIMKKQTEERDKEYGGEEEEAEEEPSRNPNPYYFPKYTLEPRYVAEEGGYHALQRLSWLSPLLRGEVKNYRLAFFQIMPRTFVLPYHIDAQSLYVVCAGKGTLTFVMKSKKQSFRIENGDVIRVPGGATTYLINDPTSRQDLHLLQLIHPLNIPDSFQEFFPAGYKNPDPDADYRFLHSAKSYLSAFSNDILESALDIRREQLKEAFGQPRREGMIIRASKEQLQALTKQPSPWWRKLIPWLKDDDGDADFKFNLQNQNPLYSNNYGKFYEAPPQDFKQLQDMNVSVGILDINPEVMMVPHYNSKITYLMMVVDGMGWFEMASHQFTIPESEEELESYEEEDQGSTGVLYIKASGKLSVGDVFVAPAGHPLAIVAQKKDTGKSQNLRIVGFGINAGEENNLRNFLAGQDGNVMKLMEREAQLLTFGQEMEQLLGNQKQSYFVPAPERKRRRQG